MSRVAYAGKLLRPSPFVNITKTYQKSGDDLIVGSLYTITISGTIVAFKGSPNSSKVFDSTGNGLADENIDNDSRLAAIIRKQEAIRELFSEEGKEFYIQSDDASEPLKLYPRIVSVNVPEGAWYNTAPYQVTLEVDRLPNEDDKLLGTNYYISSANENWSLETDDQNPESENIPRTYRLTHSVSADGKRVYDETGALTKQPWEHAKEFCLSKKGLDSTFVNSNNVNNLSGYDGYNRVISENIDEIGGSYTLTETWTLASDTALEDYTVTTTTSLDESITSVTIDGNITGLEERDSSMSITTSKIDNAETKWDTVKSSLFSRATTHSGISNLNTNASSTTVGKNPFTGVINYTYEYDNRPAKVITGSKSEVISISYDGGGDVFAEIPILGRAKGPLLQDMGTINSKTRSLNIEALFGPAALTPSGIKNSLTNNPRLSGQASSDIQEIIDAVDPSNEGVSSSFKGNPQDNYDPITGRYVFSVTWTYQE